MIINLSFKILFSSDITNDYQEILIKKLDFNKTKFLI